MRRALRTRTAKIIGIPGVALVVLLAGVALVAWSGIYNVAASQGHWRIVDRFLAFGMRNSVATRALAISAPRLDDPDLVRLGAAHFHNGCAYCHPGPGTRMNPIAERMLPSPPDLSNVVNDWKHEELFWIVKHGIKYTGMPAWVALERDDEVWAVVAFLIKLPGLDAGAYRRLALGGLQAARPAGRELALVESNPEAAGACARCHGFDGTLPSSRLVPVLHGQPAEFLALALREYAQGRRKSGIMQPIASQLAEDTIAPLTNYYAALSPPSGQASPQVDQAAVEKGHHIATQGLPAERVPPCVTCHGNDSLPSYPRLAGQPAEYMIAQLRLWQRGVNVDSDGGRVMGPIARRLSDSQIEEVSHYFATTSRVSSKEPGRP